MSVQINTGTHYAQEKNKTGQPDWCHLGDLFFFVGIFYGPLTYMFLDLSPLYQRTAAPN